MQPPATGLFRYAFIERYDSTNCGQLPLADGLSPPLGERQSCTQYPAFFGNNLSFLIVRQTTGSIKQFT